MKKFAIVVMAILAIGLAGPAFAEGAGQFTELEGSVSVERASAGTNRPVLGSKVFQGDVVVTERGGRATLLFNDGSVMRLGSSTTLEINELVYEEEEGVGSYIYNVAAGTVMSIVGSIFGNDDSDYEVRTPTAVSGVRGTTFIVKVGVHPQTGEMTTMLVGVEGSVAYSGQDGTEVNVGGGEYSNAPAGGGASNPSPISESDLNALLDSVRVSSSSLEQRASGMRQQGAGDTPGGTGDGYTPPEFGSGDGDGTGENPEDLPTNLDNPQDVIFDEPPQFSELILSVEFPF